MNEYNKVRKYWLETVPQWELTGTNSNTTSTTADSKGITFITLYYLPTKLQWNLVSKASVQLRRIVTYFEFPHWTFGQR